MFHVASQKNVNQNTLMTDREFEDYCSAKSYEPKDRIKLAQALTKQSASGRGISLFLLKQYKQKYDE